MYRFLLVAILSVGCGGGSLVPEDVATNASPATDASSDSGLPDAGPQPVDAGPARPDASVPDAGPLRDLNLTCAGNLNAQYRYYFNLDRSAALGKETIISTIGSGTAYNSSTTYYSASDASYDVATSVVSYDQSFWTMTLRYDNGITVVQNNHDTNTSMTFTMPVTDCNY